MANLGYTGSATANDYDHPDYITTNINTSGATIVDVITTNSTGHVTALGTRTLTLANLGYTGDTDANNFSLPFTDNSSNWNTAYGWGNHSAAGYLTSYTDTTYAAGTGISLSGTTFSLSDTNAKLNLSGGTLTGNLTMNGNITMQDSHYTYWGTDSDNRMWFNGSHLYLDVGRSSGVTTADFIIRDDTTQKFRFYTGSGNFLADGNITAYSDARLKDEIEPIPDAVDKVKQLRGVTYIRTDKEEAHVRHTGVIAQEVLEVLPEVVSQDDDGIYAVAYGNMVGLLIEAIKEQQVQIDALKESL